MTDVKQMVLGHVRAIWRRRWIAVCVAWVVMVLGTGAVLMLPDRYQSSSRIIADTDSLMGPLLKGLTVQDNLESQLKVMQATLLSRPNLFEVMRSLDLDLEANNTQEVEAIVRRLASNTRVQVTGPKLFRISHTDTDPVRAKNVVQAFLTIFVETNLGDDRTDMENARSFIERQIESYKSLLRDTERRIAEFKMRHSDVISPSGNSHSARLEIALGRVSDAEFALSDAKARLGRIEDQLREADPYRSQLLQARAELDRKRVLYTDSHPEIVTLRGEVERLEALGAEAMNAVNRSTDDEATDPFVAELKLRRVEEQATVEIAERRLAAERESLTRLRQKANEAPLLEAEFADLKRDYDVYRANYDELVARLESAKLSQDAKSNTETVRFQIVEPPEVPNEPTGPNRPLFLTAILIASVGGGLAVAFLLSEVSTTFASSQRLSEVFKYPVLGSVSAIPSNASTALLAFGSTLWMITVGGFFAFFAIVFVLSSGWLGTGLSLSAIRSALSAIGL